MSPRRYDMSKRSAAVDETRRRIVEATMELHNSQGILATSWEEIAERAGVAPATVYRHFPTLDELLPACGARSLELLELPDDDSIERVLSEAGDGSGRVRAMVDALFAIYERGEGVLRSIERDRAALPPVESAHQEVAERTDALVVAAIGRRRGGRAIDAAAALSSFGTWLALRERGITGREAAETCAAAIEAALERRA